MTGYSEQFIVDSLQQNRETSVSLFLCLLKYSNLQYLTARRDGRALRLPFVFIKSAILRIADAQNDVFSVFISVPKAHLSLCPWPSALGPICSSFPLFPFGAGGFLKTAYGVVLSIKQEKGSCVRNFVGPAYYIL